MREGNRNFYRLVERAYVRDGKTTHTGESVLIAALLHVKGRGRDSSDATDVRRIMRDRNLSD